ncbi:DUF262 domain-containing protein [Alicyclobacillus acidiphilus]|uniref:DUF262 domain-containing protein n=1 Tax=Alicyclobacillus acidiphilus TaxID=182455 RepID=UPI00082A291E|nr:DUF262 domain-containing protein [Alicyclobacillus acidiphilus]
MKTARIRHKVSELHKMKEKGKLSFELTIQRKRNIWDETRQSKLIHSILAGFLIPNLSGSRGETMLHILDGNQRLSSIFDYIEGKYKLVGVQSVDGGELAGKKFAELTDDLQQKIMDYKFEIDVIEEATQEQMEEQFYRLNNGVPIRPIELIRANLGDSVLKFVERISSLPFFDKKVNLSKAAKRRFVDQELVLQILLLVHHPDTGFSSKEIRAFVQELRDSGIQDVLQAKMENASAFLNEAFAGDSKKTFLKKAHVPMLFKLVLDIQKYALEITPQQFAEWAQPFLENPPAEYKEASQAGSARKENVQRRLMVMREAFNSHFKTQLQADVASGADEVAATVETGQEQGNEGAN